MSIFEKGVSVLETKTFLLKTIIFSDILKPLKLVNTISAIIVILANFYFLPLTFSILISGGGAMGFGLLFLPFSIPINLSLIPALLTFRKKHFEYARFVVVNFIGAIWVLMLLGLRLYL